MKKRALFFLHILVFITGTAEYAYVDPVDRHHMVCSTGRRSPARHPISLEFVSYLGTFALSHCAHKRLHHDFCFFLRKESEGLTGK